MTENEAKKKWCPMIRVVIGCNNSTWQGIAYTNRRGAGIGDECMCIASDCIMWRWEGDEKGYCGLGGKL